ncbi:chitin synthase chs-1-like [Erpetoichthys calabaricus]|uniref:chitin synthase chs-1-like n=1 Tax=Erpetoichthys calabaricus TaxID=27687 RepID=UPI0010A09568|nr:chitin synthase chs-1-like [Erpetoichthys calabaricus]
MDDKETVRQKRFLRSKWDPFRLKPVLDEEEKPTHCLRLINFVVCTLLGVLVFAFGFLSKISLLLMVTITDPESSAISNKPFGLLILGCTLIFPNILTFIKSLWKVIFKSTGLPSKQLVFFVCTIDLLVASGMAALVVIAMPKFDILNNTMILNSVCIVPAVLQVINQMTPSRNILQIICSLLSVFFVLLGYAIFTVSYVTKPNGTTPYLYICVAIGGTLLVSLNWWENFTAPLKNSMLQNIHKSLHKSRDIMYLISSFVRIIVTGIIVGVYSVYSDNSQPFSRSISLTTIKYTMSLFAIQVISSALCRWLSVIAFKMHVFRRSFIVPMIFTTPAVFASFLILFGVRYLYFQNDWHFSNSSLSFYCQQSSSYTGQANPAAAMLFIDVSKNFCSKSAIVGNNILPNILLAVSSIGWLLGLALSTIYLWQIKIPRIERTSEVFVRHLYEGAFIDQSMLLNVRMNMGEAETNDSREKWSKKDHVMIYLCATMWHETFEEMLKILTSLFRLDRYQPKKMSQKNKMSIEAHIFFDDAFVEIEESGRKKLVVNEYAECLVEVISEVYKVFTEKKNSKLNDDPDNVIKHDMIKTPYGGRLCYMLPEGNYLYIHFKDKTRIRHKKRWSQIMYMYYLLGWKLHKKYADAYGGDELNENQEYKKEKHNTYILALDGDTDFQPSALMLLVDRLRMYPNVGAACGRIHPTGMGPLVWYQKFEYAVGHWLLKTAEHVFGCVLCSPGCFSLFRGSALMEDNVIKRYTTKAAEASHYVQYDQGEDRWLCTLLLQQGWRVEYNAASDAYTNAPQEFKEFYNQRRRWGPSSMANTLDLLDTGALTAKKNPSISRPYIVYQIFAMASSILGPATVCLMIAGCLQFIFNLAANLSLFLSILLPVLYLIVCYTTKSDTQINVAALLSIIYAFLMTATFIAIIGDIVSSNTIMSPTGLFLSTMGLIYVITALMHPQEFPILIYGLLYIICVPSAYLLLAIYSMTNMDNVSWGTRETASPVKQKKKISTKKHVKYRKSCKCCCWNLEFSVNEEQKITEATETKGLLNDKDSSDEEQTDDLVSQDSRVQECWMEQLQTKSDEVELVERDIDSDEMPFWTGLIEEYLEPLEEDKDKQEKIKKELKSLRNKCTFLYFIINSLWIIATFFLQAIGNTVSIRIPKILFNGTRAEDIFVDPVGFMFLLSFAGLVILQFVAMLYHRIYTFIHLISYVRTEAIPNYTDAKKRQISDDLDMNDTFLSTV